MNRKKMKSLNLALDPTGLKNISIQETKGEYDKKMETLYILNSSQSPLCVSSFPFMIKNI